MGALEHHGLLVEVLKHLSNVQDVLCCSMVSRAWQAASQHVHLESLNFDLHSDEVFFDTWDKDILRHFQQCSSRGNFDELKTVDIRIAELSADMEPETCLKTRNRNMYRFLRTMWQSIMLPQAVSVDGDTMTAMTSCRLEGQFRMYKTVVHLPATLQHIYLVPSVDGCDDEIYLSLFERFCDLQTLEVSIMYGYLAHLHSDLLVPNKPTFVLDAKLKALNTLYLLDEGGLTIGHGMSFASSLPSLVSVAVSVSMQDANALLKMPSLEYAIFRRFDMHQDAGVLRERQLLVGMSSKLRVLLLEKLCRTRILKADMVLDRLVPSWDMNAGVDEIEDQLDLKMPFELLNK